MAGASFYRVAYLDRSTSKKASRDFYVKSSKAARDSAYEFGEVLSVQEHKPPLFASKAFARTYSMAFLRAMQFHTKSGASAGRAMLRVIESEQDPKLRNKLQPALGLLNRGGTFSDALEALKMFDGSILALLRAGEATGKLSDQITACIDYLDNRQTLWRATGAKMGAIVFEFFGGFSAVLAIPMYIEHLKSGGMDSKDPEKVAAFNNAIAHAELITNITIYGTYACLAALAVVAVMYMSDNRAARAGVERVAKKVPFLKSILVDSAMSDAMRVLSKLMHGRVPFNDAIVLATAKSRSPAVREYWGQVAKQVGKGLPLGRAMASVEGLTHDEQTIVKSHQDLSQFALSLETFSEERLFFYAEAMKKAVKYALLSILFYGVIFGYLGWTLVSVQDMGMAGSMDGMSGI